MLVFGFIKNFILTFISAFVTSAIAIYLYNLIVYGSGNVDWAYPLWFGVAFGVVFGITSSLAVKRRDAK